MTALPDSNTSNAIGETMLIAGQRAADPALLTPSDAFIDPPNTAPGGLAHYEAEALGELGFNAIRPIEVGRGFPLTFDIQQQNREQIRTAFMAHLFNLPIGGPEMTATEVVRRSEDLIRETGGVFKRLETDYTAPLNERQFNVMLRAGGFLPIPEVLQGRGVRFEYESPIKRIREHAQAVAARAWALEQAELEGVSPGAFDIVDTDALGRFTHAAQNLPDSIVRGSDAVAALRKARAEAQQAEIEAAELQQGAEIADKAAGAAQKAGLVDEPAAQGK